MTPEELQHALRRIIASFSAAELAVFAAVALAVKQQRSPATVRQRVRKLVSDLRSGVSDDVGAVLLAAYGIGFAKSVKEAQEVPRLARIVTHFKEPSLEAIAKLQAEYEHSVDAAAVRILRYADDVYRDVIAQATTKGLEGMAGEATRLKTAQAALDSFASRGVIVFDSSGRTMNLVSYVEMATRTATMNAERAASLAGYAALGEDLVFINDSASACPECAPFEGQILSVSGDDPAYVSLDDAEAEGLFHPNCEHTPSLYVEGLTTLPDANVADLERYAAEQQQRYLERGVRAWKVRSAAAVDEQAQTRSAAKVKEWQGRLRSHVAANNLPRQYGRESVAGPR